MATNHASDRRQKSTRRGTAQGGGAHSGEKKAGSHGTFEQVRGQASHYLEQGAAQVRELTRDHEGTAVLVALAAGFGVGLVIGGVLAGSSRPKRFSDRLAAEGLGRRILNRIEGYLPDAITDRIG